MIMYAIPLLMLFVMVVRLIHALKKASDRRTQMTGKKSEATEDLTKILITMVIIFLISQVNDIITLFTLKEACISLLN